MEKTYTKAPLPFMGQKRLFVKEFEKVLSKCPDEIIIVDLFGGSGLLSHVAKRAKPLSKVVYNDYDNYSRRLSHIPHTNALLADIAQLVAGIAKLKPVQGEAKQRILSRIRQEEEKNGYVDYITLSSNLLFSMKYVGNFEELCKQGFYNKVSSCKYDASGYLDGIEVVCKDYKELLNEYKDTPNVLFVVDPPYLSTEVGTYTMNWNIGDYLDVLAILGGLRYVYFTSNKTSIVEICEWMGRNPSIGNPFGNATKVSLRATMNYNSSYTDMMLHNMAA